MSSNSNSRQRRTGGPIGGLIKLVGTGVGAAVEYHGHRKQRKAAHDSAQSSPQDESVVAGPSAQANEQSMARSTPDNEPPSYFQSTNSDSNRQLAAGAPASDVKKTYSDSDDSSSDYLSDEITPIENDEEAWQLDEIAAATELPPSYENATSEDADAFARDLAVRNANHKQSNIGKLPLPVIIPQRRPRNKTRGFVRAYSPVLEDVGIDQKTFLQFLKSFHASSQANPCFNAVMVAAGIAGLVPDPIVMAVTTSVQIVAGIGKEFDSRRKTNNFLDRMNDTLFKPAGCYAFIMKYKSDAEVAASGGGLLAKFGIGAAQVDFSTSKAVAKYDIPSPEEGASSNMAEKMRKLRLTSGETRGSFKMLEAAPLIYPEIDQVVYSGKNGEETFKDKTRDAKKFLAGYADRRAQMKYAQNDPSSALVVPESERTHQSKWSDPNHPMFNGGLIGLISGGYIDAGRHRAEKRERRLERKEQRWERRHGSRSDYQGSGHAPYGQRDFDTNRRPNDEEEADYFNRGSRHRANPRDKRAARGGGPGGVIGAVKKVMQEDVLYLMIVPMPSEAELAEARELLAMEKEKR